MKYSCVLLYAVALFGATAAADIEEDYYKLLNVKQDATNPQVRAVNTLHANDNNPASGRPPEMCGTTCRSKPSTLRPRCLRTNLQLCTVCSYRTVHTTRRVTQPSCSTVDTSQMEEEKSVWFTTLYTACTPTCPGNCIGIH